MRGTKRERGQAALETAIAVPLLLLMMLGIVQLACAQTARLLLQGAAFHAARAGSVWNGDPARMADAARFALLPSLGATHDADHLGDTWERAQALDETFKAQGSFPDGWVRVETLAPRATDFLTDSPQELEAEAKASGQAPELRVRVRVLYELSLPLAGDAVFLAWMAERAQATLTYPLVGRWQAADDLGDVAREISADEGKPLVSAEELQALWRLWRAGHAYLPMSASYRVRLQSSFYRRFLPPGAPEGGS